MAPGRKTKLRVLAGYDVPAEGRGFAALITLVRIFSRTSDAMTDLVKPFGLTAPHFEVLLALTNGEGISQQDVSDRLLATKGNICVIMQKLEAAKLIDRRPDPTDQRFHRIYLTDSARRLLAKIMPAHNALIARTMNTLSPAEQKTLLELLLRIEQTFIDAEPGA